MRKILFLAIAATSITFMKNSEAYYVRNNSSAITIVVQKKGNATPFSVSQKEKLELQASDYPIIVAYASPIPSFSDCASKTNNRTCMVLSNPGCDTIYGKPGEPIHHANWCE